ncbi:hypothetical protein CCMA1212_003214 [Trichoderma ghanense]|uniref:Uncharacterized protein n=1 Tax=Trichoderma ghanense TaxID=65468 RepID=A0ABY2HAP0_9HYPO
MAPRSLVFKVLCRLCREVSRKVEACTPITAARYLGDVVVGLRQPQQGEVWRHHPQAQHLHENLSGAWGGPEHGTGYLYFRSQISDGRQEPETNKETKSSVRSEEVGAKGQKRREGEAPAWEDV